MNDFDVTDEMFSEVQANAEHASGHFEGVVFWPSTPNGGWDYELFETYREAELASDRYDPDAISMYL